MRKASRTVLLAITTFLLASKAVAGFNGGYIGYIIRDEWYDLKEYETFYMNWFGPHNGAYFVEMIQKLLEI